MRQFLLYPFGEPSYTRNRIFDTTFKILKEELGKRGVKLDTFDLGELAKADKVLVFNHDEKFRRQCRQAGLPAEKMALFCFEPRVVLPRQYVRAVEDSYGSVFVHDRGRVDGRRFFHLRYPQAPGMLKDLPEFSSRGFLTLINANKYSPVEGELYGLRRRAIRYFEAHEPGFDLYGYGWSEGFKALKKLCLSPGAWRRPAALLRDLAGGGKPYPSYRGQVADKHKTLATYRFAICFENESAPGYVTEKIFDCLVAGTVPVYLGAPDIARVVPEGCYVDMRRFKGFQEMHEHLKALGQEEVSRMQGAMADFLGSEAFREWQPESVFGTFASDLCQGKG